MQYQIPRASPGDNLVILHTSPSDREADALIRSLAAHEIHCSVSRSALRTWVLPANAPSEIPVDIRVRRSDLERAKRIAKGFRAAAVQA
jgi:hypothetical protein